MIARVILVVVFLIPTIAAGYMTWLTWRTGDDGKWLFGIFTLFFLLLAATPILPKFKPKPEAQFTSTRFVPHWFMMLAALVFVVAVLAAIVGAILRH